MLVLLRTARDISNSEAAVIMVDPPYSMIEDFGGLLHQMNVQVGYESVSLRSVRGHHSKPERRERESRQALVTTRHPSCISKMIVESTPKMQTKGDILSISNMTGEAGALIGKNLAFQPRARFSHGEPDKTSCMGCWTII